MKILLTGKNGQVGFELQRALAPLGEIVAVDYAECDLSRPDGIRALMRRTRPDMVINPAAYTAVDKAESEPEAAFAINGAAPGILGEEAVRLGAPVIHYSTDYVFDGEKATPYGEDDTPNPRNIYGKSKLAGERALRESGADCLIFRTSWVFGAHGNNFAKTMLKLAEERETLNVIADQFGAPTSAALIADVTAQIVGCRLSGRRDGNDSAFGIYHLVAAGSTTWHGYAQTVLATAHGAGRPLRLLPENIHPITTAEYPLPASRPANSRLDTRKFQDAFGLRLPDWRVGLEYVLKQIGL